MGSQGLLLCIRNKILKSNSKLWYIWTMDLLTEHDVHNVILDFWIFDFGNLYFFDCSFKFRKSTGVLLGFDMLDSLAFLFCFLWDFDHILIMQDLKHRQHLPLFYGVQKMCCWAQALFYCENVENTKIEKKRTAFLLVLWGLKIRVLSTGTGNLNLSGRRLRHEASMGSLPNPGAAASQPWHEASNGEPA